LDPDTWHRERLVPILKRANLYRPGTGLHSIRHTYVSLLIAQGEDVGYIADQVCHSTTRLTQDLYRHVFRGARIAAMRRLNAAIPCSTRVTSAAETPSTGENGAERERRGE
jgi:integrase